MSPLISVIIPTYNEARDIAACLSSLKRQTYTPTEIIVVDDGSTDSTIQIVKKFKIKPLTQRHLGPGPARNLGAKHAKGEIYVFVDADMTFAPDFLAKLTDPIRTKKAVGTYSLEEFVSNWDNPWARCWNFNNGNPREVRVRPNRHDREDFRAILATDFTRIGGFDPIGYTDSRTLVTKLGNWPTPAPGAVYYHRNPDHLAEIFSQARWIGRRRTRFGLFGQFVNLIRYSPPVSFLMGIILAIKYSQTRLFLFKLVYDFGFLTGIISNIFTRRNSK